MKRITYAVWMCLIGLMLGFCGKADTKAAAVGVYELSEEKKNTAYDVTGDGVADTVKFERIELDENYFQGFKMLVNDEVVYETDEMFCVIEPYFIQTKGHGYFYFNICVDNIDGPRVIYEYVDGELEERMDFSDFTTGVFYHDTIQNIVARNNQIDLEVKGASEMLADTTMKLSVKVNSNGTLSLKSKVAKVTYSNRRYNENTYKEYTSKYLVAAKSIKVYKSATGSKKAFTVKKGTKLKITKVSLQGKKTRYYCVTTSGKKGWMTSKYGLFKELYYVG